MGDKSLYERAVELAQTRPSISATNIKTSLNCTDAQAKSFIQIMIEEKVIGGETTAIGRYPVLVYQGPRYDGDAVINLDTPEQSVIPEGADAETILDRQGQQKLRQIMTELIELEAEQSSIGDRRRIIMEVAKAHGLVPKILKKLASTLFKNKKQELLNGIDLTQQYLHGLGELVDADPSDLPPQGAPSGSSVH